MAAIKLDRRKARRVRDPELRGRRAGPRAEIVLPASLEALSGHRSIYLLDISLLGACLKGAALPPTGREVILKCGSVDAFATVAWSADERCGIRFDEPISPRELMSLRRLAVDAEKSGRTAEELQAVADWMNGLAR